MNKSRLDQLFYRFQVVYYNLYFWFRVVCVHLGPCASLVVLNVLLFGALRSAQQKRDKLFKENRKASECRKLRDSNCTTLMLIVVVSCFLVVEIPLAVLTVLHIFEASLDLKVLDYDAINVLILFTNFVISLSYPINFAIYCGMSRQVGIRFYSFCSIISQRNFISIISSSGKPSKVCLLLRHRRRGSQVALIKVLLR